MTFSIKKLEWDTIFFDVPCSRVDLFYDKKNSIDHIDFNENEIIRNSKFITIFNYNNSINNNVLISKYTDSFFIDFNIQFKKKKNRNRNVFDDSEIILLNRNNFSLEDLTFEPNFTKSRFSKDVNIG